MESKGLRFDSSLVLWIYPLYYAHDKKKIPLEKKKKTGTWVSKGNSATTESECQVVNLQ